MKSQKIISQINEEIVNSKIEERVSIVLDTNVWIDISENKNDQAVKIKAFLKDLVADKKIFCPLTYSMLSEIRKQDYSSALKVAELINELSLGVDFAEDNIIYDLEIENFLENAIKEKETLINKCKIYRLSKLQDVLELIKFKIPILENKSIDIFGWKERWGNNNGNKTILRKNERNFVLKKIQNTLLEKLIEKAIDQESLLDLKQKFFNYLSSFPKDEDNTPSTTVLKKMPAHSNLFEVMTFTGFDPNRKGRINDLYDIQLMIIPFTYADILFAPDRWIRSSMETYRKHLHKNSAKYIGNWGEFEEYLRTL